MPANDTSTGPGISLGETRDQGSLRVHRWNDGFEVTDLTNAGKRGKTCRTLRITGGSYGAPYRPADGAGWDAYAEPLASFRTIEQVMAFVQDVLTRYPRSIEMRGGAKRGVDVTKPGEAPLRFRREHADGTIVDLTAEPHEFRLTNSVLMTRTAPNGKVLPSFRQDTSYWTTDKKAARRFYDWVKGHMVGASAMKLDGFRAVWDALGVRYDSH